MSNHALEADAAARRLRRRSTAGGKKLGRQLVGLARRSGRSGSGRASKGRGSWSKSGRQVSALLKIHHGGRAGDAYAARQVGAILVDTNLAGRTPQARAAEWRLDELKHPGVDPKNLFVHLSISRPVGHALAPEIWKEFIAIFLKKIDAERNQFISYQHPSATSNDHIHLIFSRSKNDGSLTSNSNNFWRWRAAAREAAAELRIEVPDLAEAEAPQARQAPTPASDREESARRRAKRRGTVEPHIDRAIVFEALTGSTSRSQFESRLAARGVELRDARRADGTTAGLLFRKSGADEFLAGSSIDRSFSLQKIEAQLAENRRLLLFKQERQAVIQRQRAAIERQRQAQQVQGPRER